MPCAAQEAGRLSGSVSLRERGAKRRAGVEYNLKGAVLRLRCLRSQWPSRHDAPAPRLRPTVAARRGQPWFRVCVFRSEPGQHGPSAVSPHANLERSETVCSESDLQEQAPETSQWDARLPHRGPVFRQIEFGDALLSATPTLSSVPRPGTQSACLPVL